MEIKEMKYEVDYEIDGILRTATVHGESAGEAFAKCLVSNSTCTLKKCRKIGLDGKGFNDAKMGITEWDPPPVQRKPVEPPPSPPARVTPKYLEPKDPMPSMREWYQKRASEISKNV
jgi:hypothetical protein